MGRVMANLKDLVEEFKVRTVYWAICIFAISYFLSHTSKSMWTNIPMSALILSAVRYLSYEVELRWKVQPVCHQTHLAQLEKKQLSLDDSCLSSAPAIPRWRRKIDSPPVEAAFDELISKILQDFVVDLWYSSVTPDKEAPELIHAIILDALGEISERIKEINLVDLLTRDMVDVIGKHLDLFRKIQAEIGVDDMGILSSEERDARLKCQLMASKELHPALVSPECEHKVLQHIIGGVLAVVLKPQESQCPLARCFSREFLTCLVIQPVMNFASPEYVNELIEYIFLSSKDNKGGQVGSDGSSNINVTVNGPSVPVGNTYAGPESKITTISNRPADIKSSKTDGIMSLETSVRSHPNKPLEDTVHYFHSQPADWANILDAGANGRSEVLVSANLENMWNKGKVCRKNGSNLIKEGALSSGPEITTSKISNTYRHTGNSLKGILDLNEQAAVVEDKYMVHIMQGSDDFSRPVLERDKAAHNSEGLISETSTKGSNLGDGCEGNTMKPVKSSNSLLKRSICTPDTDTVIMCGETIGMKELYSPKLHRRDTEPSGAFITFGERDLYAPKIKCRVVGASFEKAGSKPFVVYSISVTDEDNKTWFVKRRYRNFERLHRHLKDVPNYSLHLPPKNFLSSGIDDHFIHQRCVLLDKYLQDLLSIANVAEQHEVWDFLSFSSKNYSYGKSTSVMKTLAVNVDDAMDDIVRQFKSVSDDLRRRVVGSSSSSSTSLAEKSSAITWKEEINMHRSIDTNVKIAHGQSACGPSDKDHSATNTWHLNNEVNSGIFSPRVVNHMEESIKLDFPKNQPADNKTSVVTDLLQDLDRIPPEWIPQNASLPLLNLVDKIFLLNQHGWLRRQVFWISKQLLQLIMDDAIDDWILRQINSLRNEEVIAQTIHSIQDVLWPNGTFFKTLESYDQAKVGVQTSSRAFGVGISKSSSFDARSEAARRASFVKKIILGSAPASLVSLIGYKQYHRCAEDIYYFLQSSIFLKQLAYAMLESVLLSLFPELQDITSKNIHKKTHTSS
ncbi:hypothetical protein J5N97_012084 [Dioscorea zingiberensis]|uniref:Uncharacterized protein n=1 Tax=Dioscorea zingiberensis TaxID=325984 RepID=A0A9D5CNI7_9LILI|nr:hypothetical protein J5N97_012084 [Dioscorea zingiberensis]